MIAGGRVGILGLAVLAASGLVRAQDAAPAAAVPLDEHPGVARPAAETPLSIRSASLLRAATPTRDARAQARTPWPQLETVYETGSKRPSHRLELLHFGADSSVLMTYKRSGPQLIWRKSLD